MTPLEKILALTPRTPEASTVPKPIHSGGPGLWHHKGMMAPPYVEHVAQALMRRGKSESEAYHMAVGLMHSWAAGHDGHGHKTHPDVRAAAAKNLAQWEALRAKAHAKHLARSGRDHSRGKKDHDLAASAAWDEIADAMLELAQSCRGDIAELASGPTYFYDSSMLKGGSEASAPGAKRLAGNQLRQEPSQTVAAGPPLPPAVPLPSPAELDALGAAIAAAGLPGSDLIRGAAQHARTAAMKMRAGQAPDALRLLRACQAGIRSAHHEFNAEQIPVANVFSARLSPAEAASARAEMFEGLKTRDTFRALATQCAQLIDRIRRHVFHGLYNHLAEARFAGGSLGRVLALAQDQQVAAAATMVYLQLPPGLFPDTGLDKPGHLTVVYAGRTTPDEFRTVCERAAAAARAVPPVHLTVGGLGLFEPSDSSDGKRVAYCPVHCGGVTHLRSLLADLSASEHEFTPHVTLAYLDDGQEPPAPVTSARVSCHQLLCARGDEVRAFALSGKSRAWR